MNIQAYRRPLLLLTVLAMLLALLPAAAVADNDRADAAAEPPPAASGFTFRKYSDPTCAVADLAVTTDRFSRDDCGFGEFATSNTTETSTVSVRFLGPDGAAFHTQELDNGGANATYTFDIAPAAEWPAGVITVEAVIDGDAAGTGQFKHNFLGATLEAAVKPDGEPYRSGETVDLTGTVFQADTNDVTGGDTESGVPAELSLAVTNAAGEELGRLGPLTAADDGTFAATIPADITEDVEAGFRTDFLTTVAVRVVDATYNDESTGAWAAEESGAGAVEFFDPATELVLQTRFVSSKGWVKPGDEYPFRVLVHNFTDQAQRDIRVTIPTPGGTRFLGANADRGDAGIADRTITWTMASLPAAAEGQPTTAELIVDAKARTLGKDPRIVWKDLSARATLRYAGGDRQRSRTHGPKVIPPDGTYDTARYGDKPFPMVPVEYQDRKHQPEHQGEDLDRVVNDPSFEGSTWNLYQEMSFGQLFPEGTVPSAGIASATYADYEPGFDFTTYNPSTSSAPCRGATAAQIPGAVGSPAYNERIVDGWYQLPGTTEYYGGDFPAFTLGVAGSIDSACGQLGKVTYDAAAAADPDINYNDYDSDRDGVVDFFMTVTVGCGGNGSSQLSVAGCPYADAPYDNVWPHSSDLQMQYRDPETGLRGYVSDDQLTDLEGDPQCFTSDVRSEFADCASEEGKEDFPVPIRVGPYNVNPETSFDSASVISHEYGHHLGLPDFYSDYSAYGDMNLMAADYSQHMTVFSKQELGWVVPEFLQPGQSRNVENWSEIKSDTGKIKWYTPDGERYTLSEANGDANIHNGEAYGMKLPQRILIDPAVVEEGASLAHVWYSGRGNDFGCAPDAARNLDVFLPELRDVPADTPITVTFKSSWDIEWDWDYGFVMTSGDGREYAAQPSENGYTTPNAYNPNGIQCLEQHNNGLTGQSGAYAKGEAEVVESRNPADNRYDNGAPFLEDSYDISELAGTENPVLRFSYNTDGAFDRPGWFIDDVEVRAGEEVIYSSNFEEDAERDRLFPGGCAERLNVSLVCTKGWTRVNAELPSAQDHGYYLELRDQSGFDFDGHGQSDRGDTSWDPGVLLEYTDEAHGYGNNGVVEPPAQHYLDSQPSPGADCGEEVNGNCADASFTRAAGDRMFTDHKTPEQPLGWIDNFFDDRREPACVDACDSDEPVMVNPWLFDYGCLTLNVQSMDGESVGPEALPADLTADARISAADGCRPFEYAGALDITPTRPNQACPSLMVPATGYNDIDTSIHRANIACIAWYTITVGATADQYAPDASVSRGQMASFIARLAVEAGLIGSLDAAVPDAFGDDDDNVHESAINALAAADLVSGTGRKAFSPGKRVSRQQMASFIANLHRKAVPDVEEADKDYFDDDNTSVHEPNINLLAELEVIRGVGENKFAPRRNVSREQMATFIAADLGLLVNAGKAFTGGAGVTLDDIQADPDGAITGKLATNKTLESFTADGCGSDGRDIDVAADGTFSVPVEGQESGTKCSLQLTTQTSRATGGGDETTQKAVYDYVITIR